MWCWESDRLLNIFPPAAPNDPLVPTAVLGETGSIVFTVASVSLFFFFFFFTPSSSQTPCLQASLYVLVHLCIELDQSWDVWNVERIFFYSCFYFSLCQVQFYRLARLDFWYHVQIFLICDIFRHVSLSHTLIIHRLQNCGVACPLHPPPFGCIVIAQQKVSQSWRNSRMITRYHHYVVYEMSHKRRHYFKHFLHPEEEKDLCASTMCNSTQMSKW